MESTDRRRDDNSRDNSVSRHGSMDSNRPIEMNSNMEVDDIKRGSGHENVQSGRVHKGGRKLIYATLEERKERNRQAQATFRERRIVYVAQLEKTIQEQRDELRRLQNACSSATDERLNLKYKNSLLERILLEKGVEVRAELDAEIPIQPHKIPKERKPSVRRSKPAVICRRHSSITSEPMDMSEACRCPQSATQNNFSKGPNMADQSGQHVTERKLSAPPSVIRWQQTHVTQSMGNSPVYDGLGVMDNSVPHLGKYPPSRTPSPSKNPLVLDSFCPTGPSNNSPYTTHYHSPSQYGPPPPSHYHSASEPHSPRSTSCPRALSSATQPSASPNAYAAPHSHLEHLELEWNHLLPDAPLGPAADDPDRYPAAHTTSSSSPVSAVRTPDDFSALAHMHMGHRHQQQQQQQFVKQLEGACFDLDAASMHSYSQAHAAAAGFDMMPNDPFGLDASLFSI